MWLFIALTGCNGRTATVPSETDRDETGDTGVDPLDIAPEDSSIVGAAIKGPFAVRSKVRVFQVVDDGTITVKRQFGATNRDGQILMPPLFMTGYGVVEIEGQAFDELRGETGSPTWTLKMLAPLRDGKIVGNVNVFTQIHWKRVITLLGAQPGEFEAVREQSWREFSDIFGIRHNPEALSITNETAPSLAEDNAALLLFSTAILSAGFGQSELNTLADDFADDGLMNGDGRPLLDQLRAAASATDYEIGRQNLLARYGSAPPPNSGLDAGLWGWVRLACGALPATHEPLCAEDANTPTNDVPAGDWMTYSFIPPRSGTYMFTANFGTFNNFHRWTLSGPDDTSLGAGNQATNQGGVSDPLVAGDEYVFNAYNAGDTDTFVEIDVRTASIGTSAHPASLRFGVDEEGFVALDNTGGRAGTKSYYVVDRSQLLDVEALDVVVADVSSELRLTAFSGDYSTPPSETISTPEQQVGTAQSTQGVRLDGLDFDERLYIVVESLDGGLDPTSGVPGRIAYRIQVN